MTRIQLKRKRISKQNLVVCSPINLLFSLRTCFSSVIVSTLFLTLHQVHYTRLRLNLVINAKEQLSKFFSNNIFLHHVLLLFHRFLSYQNGRLKYIYDPKQKQQSLWQPHGKNAPLDPKKEQQSLWKSSKFRNQSLFSDPTTPPRSIQSYT